jgi:hypothetical protein
MQFYLPGPALMGLETVASRRSLRVKGFKGVCVMT